MATAPLDDFDAAHAERSDAPPCGRRLTGQLLDDRAGVPDVLLAASSITKSFEGVRALRGVSFDLRAGEVHQAC